jgi:6-phosphofructokinase 1
MDVMTLGEARFPSPIHHTVDDRIRIPIDIATVVGEPPKDAGSFELAGPRARLFFDPKQTRAGIVTCGGLCPGLNNVIRSLYLELHHIYQAKEVLGFRNGYQGLDPDTGKPPIVLCDEFVEDIHKEGGTVLGTSRGPANVVKAVDNLIRLGIDILFTVGGDGTQRGANLLFQEARKRGHALAVVGVPKTIDNDVAYVSQSFGYLTAVEEAAEVIERAHTESHSVHNGVALVKLMGRDAGFVAAGATVASQDVNFTLIPEQPFKLEGEQGFLAALKRRLQKRAHAVIVVAEGAGQDLFPAGDEQRDASGNIKIKDIGVFLKEKIEAYFKAERIPMVLRYFDPSYFVRSSRADSEDSILCDMFARNAVHAAMAGKTGLVIGQIHDHFVHVPIEQLACTKKRLQLNSSAWHAVLASTGQPLAFT